MRWASLSSPTSSQVTCGLLKSFIFIIIRGLASSCEAQEPQDAVSFSHGYPRAGTCNPPPVRQVIGPEVQWLISLTGSSDGTGNAR